MRHMRCTPVRCTPVRCTPARCTPVRCPPVRCTPHEIHTCEMHAYEVPVYETHAYQMHDRLTVNRTLVPQTHSCFAQRLQSPQLHDWERSGNSACSLVRKAASTLATFQAASALGVL